MGCACVGGGGGIAANPQRTLRFAQTASKLAPEMVTAYLLKDTYLENIYRFAKVLQKNFYLPLYNQAHL